MTKVAVCFDMDKAGQDALKRSIPLLEKKGLQTTVIVLANGKDPDESIQNSPLVFKQAVKEDVNVYEFLLQQALKQFSATTSEGKKAITQEVLPVYSLIENEIVKEHYLHELGEAIGTSLDALQKELTKQKRQQIVKTDVMVTQPNRSREEILEEYLTGLLVQSENPQRLLPGVLSLLTSYVWQKPAYQKILDKLQEFIKEQAVFDQQGFATSLPGELVSAFDTCFLLPIPQISDAEKYSQEVRRVAKDLQEIYVRRQIKIIGDTIKQQEKNGAVVELENLQEQLSHFMSLLAKKE